MRKSGASVCVGGGLQGPHSFSIFAPHPGGAGPHRTGLVAQIPQQIPPAPSTRGACHRVGRKEPPGRLRLQPPLPFPHRPPQGPGAGRVGPADCPGRLPAPGCCGFCRGGGGGWSVWPVTAERLRERWRLHHVGTQRGACVCYRITYS